jgi:virginiamycin B lyase
VDRGKIMRSIRSPFLLGLVLVVAPLLAASPAYAVRRITQYRIPTPDSDPEDITSGPDGNLWFTEFLGNKIGRVTPRGAITEYPVPTVGGDPEGIAAGPDGNLWFTEFNGDKIGRITTGGAITEFPLPSYDSWPYGIAAGPDGNLWFCELNANQIGRITTGGPSPSSRSPRRGAIR